MAGVACKQDTVSWAAIEGVAERVWGRCIGWTR